MSNMGDMEDDEEEAPEEEMEDDDIDSGGDTAEVEEAPKESESDPVSDGIEDDLASEEIVTDDVGPEVVTVEVAGSRPVTGKSGKSVVWCEDVAVEAEKDRGNILKRAVAGMWSSRDMLDEESDTQTIMKTTLRELILYW